VGRTAKPADLKVRALTGAPLELLGGDDGDHGKA
jgi:hypothetical protein